MTDLVTAPNGAKFTLFFSIRSPFSNFHPCQMIINEQQPNGSDSSRIFNCTEQYYMYHKAISSGDVETANEILKEREARKIKMLGRNVKNFDANKWNTICEDVMWRGNVAKYTQNDGLRKKLFYTHGSTLVECSPNDAIWGIGMDIYEPDALNPSKWRGQNKLGHLLTRIREHLWQQPQYAHEVKEAIEMLKNFENYQFARKIFQPPKPRSVSHSAYQPAPNPMIPIMNQQWMDTSASRALAVNGPSGTLDNGYMMYNNGQEKNFQLNNDRPMWSNEASALQVDKHAAALNYGYYQRSHSCDRDGNNSSKSRDRSASLHNSRRERENEHNHRYYHHHRHHHRRHRSSSSSPSSSSRASSTSSISRRKRHRSRRSHRDSESTRPRQRSSSRHCGDARSEASNESTRRRRHQRRKHSTSSSDTSSDSDSRRSRAKRTRFTSSESDHSTSDENVTKSAKNFYNNTNVFSNLLQKLRQKPSGLWEKMANADGQQQQLPFEHSLSSDDNQLLHT